MKTPFRSRDSSVLVLVLILTAVLLVIAGSALSVLTHEYKHSMRSTIWSESLFMSEGGVELAFNAVNQSGSMTNAWSGWTPSSIAATNHSITLSLTPNGTNSTEGTFTVACWKVTNDWVIQSTGTCKAPDSSSLTNLNRQVEIRLTPGTPWSFGILAKGNINFNGNNVIVDSYNSTTTATFTGGQYKVLTATPDPHAWLHGNVGTDGTSLNAGNGNVYGDLMVGVNGHITEGPMGYVTGNQSDGLQVLIPDPTGPGKTITSSTAWTPSGTTLNSSTGWPTTAGTQITINNNYTMAPGDYNVSSISLSGSKTLTINATTGNVRIYVSGDISLTGNSSINITGTNVNRTVQIWVVGNVALGGNGAVAPAAWTPPQLKIYGKVPSSGTKSFTISGNSPFKGAIYAPGHDFTINGAGNTGTVYGSVVANTITMGGNANFHYDEALGNVYNSSANWDVVYWRENSVAPN